VETKVVAVISTARYSTLFSAREVAQSLKSLSEKMMSQEQAEVMILTTTVVVVVVMMDLNP